MSHNPYHKSAHSYSSKLSLPVIRRFRQVEQETLQKRFKRLEAGWSVLELGCGTGFYTRDLVSRGTSVTAVDGSAKMLEILKEELQKDAENITLLQADVNEFTPDRQYDAVVSIGLMDYLSQWKRFLDMSMNHAKSAVILSCPAATFPGWLFKVSALFEGSRVQVFSEKTLRNYFANHSKEWDVTLERVGTNAGVSGGLTWIITATRK